MLLAYMKKVYKVENTLGKLSDNRVNSTYRTSEAILPVLLGFLVRIQSLNELKYKMTQVLSSGWLYTLDCRTANA